MDGILRKKAEERGIRGLWSLWFFFPPPVSDFEINAKFTLS
jgi:hypothetical protein